MPSNRDMIQMHLEHYVYDCKLSWHYIPDWADLLSYCSGYYGEVTLDMIQIVRKLQREGKIE